MASGGPEIQLRCLLSDLNLAVNTLSSSRDTAAVTVIKDHEKLPDKNSISQLIMTYIEHKHTHLQTFSLEAEAAPPTQTHVYPYSHMHPCHYITNIILHR